MIDAARLAARGLDNVAFVLGDLETTILPSQSFDAALSRWSLMFAADRVELLRVAARLLKPGGALSAAVWGRPEEVPLISLAFRVISTYLALPPPPPGPGPFSMADPGTVTTELARGGFTDIEIRPDVVTFDFRSVDDFARFSRDVLPPGMKRLLQEQCTGVDDAALWEQFSMAASAYQSPDGHVVLPCSCTFVRAIARGGA
jgi:SAM-dependent methyltransferase